MTGRDKQFDDIYQNLQTLYVLLDESDRRVLGSVGLTPTQYNLLSLLDIDEGRPVTRLAEVLLCTRGNVTRLVQRLVDAGLVRTGPDRSDQRLLRVYLTPLGKERLTEADAVFTAANRRRLSSLSTVELSRLRALTGDLADQLIKQRDEPAVP